MVCSGKFARGNHIDNNIVNIAVKHSLHCESTTGESDCGRTRNAFVIVGITGHIGITRSSVLNANALSVEHGFDLRYCCGDFVLVFRIGDCNIEYRVTVLCYNNLAGAEIGLSEIDRLFSFFGNRKASYRYIASTGCNRADNRIECHIFYLKFKTEFVCDCSSNIHVNTDRISVVIKIFERLKLTVSRNNKSILCTVVVASGEREACADQSCKHQYCDENFAEFFHICLHSFFVWHNTITVIYNWQLFLHKFLKYSENQAYFRNIYANMRFLYAFMHFCDVFRRCPDPSFNSLTESGVCYKIE